MEIYNELMFDLLTEAGVSEQNGDLSIIEDARGNVQVGIMEPCHGARQKGWEALGGQFGISDHLSEELWAWRTPNLHARKKIHEKAKENMTCCGVWSSSMGLE